MQYPPLVPPAATPASLIPSLPPSLLFCSGADAHPQSGNSKRAKSGNSKQTQKSVADGDQCGVGPVSALAPLRGVSLPSVSL